MNGNHTADLKLQAYQLLQQRRLAEAKSLCEKICRVDASDAEGWYMLGVANAQSGSFDDAVRCCRKAIELIPEFAQAHMILGAALQYQGLTDDAITSFSRAIELQPDFAEAHNNLGSALLKQGRLGEAAASFEQACNINPGLLEARHNAGGVLLKQGKIDQAIAAFREVSRLASQTQGAGKNIADHSRTSVLLAINYCADLSKEEIYKEHVRWGNMVSAGAPSSQLFRCTRNPDRTLRIGYLSADLYEHSVTFFFEPVLSSHDTARFETICYSSSAHTDAVTGRLRASASRWRDISLMSPMKIAETIREDGIDILVDLSGHTAGNSLPVFALRPAPVQVTWLGYPNTTGLAAMDYRITDEYADPAGEDAFYTETLLRLSGCFLCYRPPADAPVVTPLPVGDSGQVTYGSFNNMAKITDKVVALWARVLQATPGSRLILKNQSLTDPETREYLHGQFTQHGIDTARIVMHGRMPSTADHLALYGQIDIALDTFPYNGTTTTCEAMWMGVPTMVLAGNRHAGRVGVSLLHAADMSDWIADSPDEYVRKSTAFASDRAGLAELRANLREKLRTSILLDATAFTGKLEDAYRNVWKKWCEAC